MVLKNYQEILRNKLKKLIELRNVKVSGKMVYVDMGFDVSFYIINVGIRRRGSFWELWVKLWDVRGIKGKVS